ncbi:MAG: hypothetical protein IJ275_03110 [Ruminococcus sp.]|nr:hypothetical protein [Ruminococcus sp.]
MLQNLDLKKYINTVYELEKSLYKQEYLRKELSKVARVYSKDAYIVNAANNPHVSEYDYKKIISEFSYDDQRELQSKYTKVKAFKSHEKFSEHFVISDLFGLPLMVALVLLVLSFIVVMAVKDVGLFSRWFFEELGESFVISLVISLLAFVAVSLFISFGGVFGCINTNRAIDKENRQIAIENQRIVAANNLSYNGRLKEKSKYDEEMRYLTNVTIKETRELLNNYYSMGIVYHKYQNLTAIASFNEYLKSGRCTTLVGHEGAYNIFEEEIRLDRILTKLDIIIEKLEQIKQNQYMLYVAIKDAQNTSENILRELKTIKNQNVDILNQAGVIAENSYITACNSQITAQNTEFLKWYHVLSS